MSSGAYLDDFYEAIQKGDIPEVRRLIQLGVDPNRAVSWDSNERPLGFAINRDNVAMVRALLEYGADPDKRDYEGETPTEIAVRGAHYKALRILLEYGEPQARQSRAIQALYKATVCEDTDLILWLLDTDMDINTPDSLGYTPLTIAIGGSAGLYRMACEPDPSATRSKIVRLLLDRGADVHAGLGADYLMHCAAGRRELQIVAWLQNAGAQMTLPTAAILGNTVRAHLLLEQGEAPNRPGFEGNSPLHYAAAKGCLEMVSLLLDHGADPLFKNGENESPLYHAACAGHIEIVSALLRNCGESEKETRVLSHAAAGGHREVTLLLLQSGWNIDGDIGEFLTPLTEAAIADLPDMVRLLIAHGADVNLANPYGYTALMCAAQHDCVDAGRALLEGGADIQVLYEHNMTAFAEALIDEQIEGE